MKRLISIDKTAPGIDILAFKVTMPFAYQTEQFIHKICQIFQPTYWGLPWLFDWGSGKTERFYIPAAIVYFIIAVPAYLFYQLLYLIIAAAILAGLYYTGKSHHDEQEQIQIHVIRTAPSTKQGAEEEQFFKLEDQERPGDLDFKRNQDSTERRKDSRTFRNGD